MQHFTQTLQTVYTTFYKTKTLQSYAQLCNTFHNYTDLHKTSKNNSTWLYTTSHNYSNLYKTLRNLTQLTTSQNSTKLYNTLHNLTHLYQNYTQLGNTSTILRTTLHNFTTLYTKQHNSTKPSKSAQAHQNKLKTIQYLTELY
jgi:hypothetical protein